MAARSGNIRCGCSLNTVRDHHLPRTSKTNNPEKRIVFVITTALFGLQSTGSEDGNPYPMGSDHGDIAGCLCLESNATLT